MIKQRPRVLVKNTSAIIQLEFSRPLSLELYKDYKELGRFMLRSSGNTVAAGLITQVGVLLLLMFREVLIKSLVDF